MRDPLGRLWKVGTPDGNRGTRLICYEKKEAGSIKTLAEVDADPMGQRHGSRTRKGGQTCNGEVFGIPRFQICAKCAADVSDRR